MRLKEKERQKPAAPKSEIKKPNKKKKKDQPQNEIPEGDEANNNGPNQGAAGI